MREEEDDINPYAPPKAAVEKPRSVFTQMPGWLLVFFGAASLMMWFVEGLDVASAEFMMTINYLVYGGSFGVAALIFGFGNLGVGKQKGPSLIAVCLGVLGLLGGLWSIYRLMD